MGTFRNRGKNKRNIILSKEFNIDNGAGTTDDDLLGYFPDAVTIREVRVVYTEASDSSMGSATIKLGTALGGAQIVAAYTLLESQSVSATANMTLVTDKLAAGSVLWARHTGIAATQTGKYRVMVQYETDA